MYLGDVVFQTDVRIFSLPPLQGRVLLRPPKPQRHVGGGQPGGAGFGAGFCPAPLKIHRNLQI